MNTINKRVWKAIGHNYILFGTIVEEKKTNGWALVRVEDLVKERFLNESR